jgi:hypothetical protein
MFKKINLFLFTILMFGFKFDRPEKWDITRNDPTIWLKFCSEIEDQDFNEDDLPSDDELIGGEVSFQEVAQSIIDDYNNIKASYLRLAFYPEDDENPGDPIEGDSEFTKSKAKTRTIEICIQNSNNPFEGGHAISKVEDGERIFCEIVLSKQVKNEINEFIGTLTHELGHCLGLDHPQATTHSIMSYFHKSEEIRLMGYDKAGLAYLYPEKGVDLTEQNTFGLSCTYKK